MIKSSVMNFVRQKAQEGADYAELHTQLKALSAIDIEGEKKKLAVAQADRAKAEKGAKDAQEAAANVQLQAASHLGEAARLKKEAEDIVAAATKRAEEIVSEARSSADDVLKSWALSFEQHKQQLASVRLELARAVTDLESKHKEHAELEKQHEELIRKHGILVGALAAMKSSL